MNELTLPDSKTVSTLFGQSGRSYMKILKLVKDRLAQQSYEFVDNSIFTTTVRSSSDNGEYARYIYTRELLCRAHMSSVSAIFRTTRWIDAAVTGYKSSNIYAWSAACRSLIESSGDIAHSLSKAAMVIAEFHRPFSAALNGSHSDQWVISSELEELLIHFTHARKLNRSDTSSPSSHRALQPWQYNKVIEEMQIAGVADLYAELCEIVHPAAHSASIPLTFAQNAWHTDFSNERQELNELVQRSRRILGNVLEAAYNPPLLVLRVLHKFRIFSKIDELKKVRFDSIPAWADIERRLKA